MIRVTVLRGSGSQAAAAFKFRPDAMGQSMTLVSARNGVSRVRLEGSESESMRILKTLTRLDSELAALASVRCPSHSCSIGESSLSRQAFCNALSRRGQSGTPGPWAVPVPWTRRETPPPLCVACSAVHLLSTWGCAHCTE